MSTLLQTTMAMADETQLQKTWAFATKERRILSCSKQAKVLGIKNWHALRRRQNIATRHANLGHRRSEPMNNQALWNQYEETPLATPLYSPYHGSGEELLSARLYFFKSSRKVRAYRVVSQH